MTRYAMTEILEEALGMSLNESRPNANIICPFHHERRKSFAINLEEGLWICFACGEKGGYEKLCQLLKTVPDEEYKIKRAYSDANRIPEDTKDFTAKARKLYDSGQGNGRQHIELFLSSRQIKLDARDTFSLGYDDGRRAISFPYPDIDNRVRGIKLRLPDGRKESETGSQYNIYHPELAFGKDKVAICEGETDTLAAWSEVGSYLGVCGTSGASVSEAQWERYALTFLFTRTVYLCYDADSAGDKCAETAMRVLGDKCIRVRPTRGNDVSDHIIAGGTLKELGIEVNP